MTGREVRQIRFQIEAVTRSPAPDRKGGGLFLSVSLFAPRRIIKFSQVSACLVGGLLDYTLGSGTPLLVLQIGFGELSSPLTGVHLLNVEQK